VLLHVTGWVLTLLADDVTPAFDLASSAALVVLPLVGALVASRRPGNAIGWLFCGAGLLLAVAGWTYGYAALALAPSEAALPGGVAAAWVTSWIFLPAVFGVPPLLFLLFPDGRPLTPRWRLAVWFTLIGLSCQAVATAVAPGPLEDSPVPGVANPVGIPNAALVDAIAIVGWTVALASIVVGTCSLVLRFRRSSGEQRLQLRWFALSAVLFLAACLVSAALFQTQYLGLGQILILVAYSTIPVAAGAAILRYRLYDIDLVINRALVYGSLSAALAVVYLGSVLLLQLVLNPLAAESDLAVAGSTLAVAAAFGPLRSRVQAVVDRRFYRRRYDASLTLEAFVGRLRHELDLEAVVGDLRAVVRETVQPSHVSLWLRRS
jgi:hypothetical protein